MFADDTKRMLDVVKSSPSLFLQNDLHAIYEWCNQWKLKLNLDKCQLIRFSNGQSHNIFPYQINNHPIPVSRMYSDLGIHINDSLIFDASQQVFISHSPHPPFTQCAHADQEATLSINHQITPNLLLTTLASTPI